MSAKAAIVLGVVIVLCTAAILGYLEFLRREASRRDAIAQARRQVDTDDAEVRTYSSTLGVTIDTWQMEKADNKPTVPDDARQVTDAMNDLMTAYAKLLDDIASLQRMGGGADLSAREDSSAFRKEQFQIHPELSEILQK